MAIRAYQSIRHCDGICACTRDDAYNLAQMLQVHLMQDARGRRDHSKVAEIILRPSDELIAFRIALEVSLQVEGKSVG
jgi:hypothetical protein